MPKGKLKVSTSEVQKVKDLATFADVTIINEVPLNGTSSLEISFKSPNELFELGKLFGSGAVLDSSEKVPTSKK